MPGAIGLVSECFLGVANGGATRTGDNDAGEAVERTLRYFTHSGHVRLDVGQGVSAQSFMDFKRICGKSNALGVEL